MTTKSNAALLKKFGAHLRMYPTPAGDDAMRVRTNLGDGKLVYATDDAWLGVQLDGETRIDEYPLELVTPLEQLAA